MPKNLKKPRSFEDTLKKYSNDVTKIPGWSSRNPDGVLKKKPIKKKVTKKGNR